MFKSNFTGRKHSPESKEKMRQAKLKNPTRYWLGKKMTTAHVRKNSEGHKGLVVGENHPNWKGDEVGYLALHSWVARQLGKPDTCEFCGESGLKGKHINWANKSGKYLRDVNDWIRLCRPCHAAYDDIARRGWITRRRNLQF